MYEWVVYAHIASILAFMFAHGVHAAAMWAMRGEPDPERMLTFFNIVPKTTSLRVILGLVVGTGALAAFMGGWWTTGWIWLSLGLLAVISAAMWRYGGPYYGTLQQAAEAAIAARTDGSPDPVAQAAYDAARRSRSVELLTAIGVVGVGLILWLMMFKPF